MSSFGAQGTWTPNNRLPRTVRYAARRCTGATGYVPDLHKIRVGTSDQQLQRPFWTNSESPLPYCWKGFSWRWTGSDLIPGLKRECQLTKLLLIGVQDKGTKRLEAPS
jgi:hypothetical protein